MINKRTVGGTIFDCFNYLLMLLVIAVIIVPFIFVINGSLVSETEFMRTGGIILIPRTFSPHVYEFLFKEGSVFNSLLLSVMRIVVGVPLAMLLTVILAYAMTKRNMPGHKALMVFLIIMMYFDGGLIPFLFMVKDLKMYDTFLMFVLPGAVSVFNALLLHNFLNTIPDSLSESARIDGASEPVILMRIILPLSLPGIATISLFYAVWHWNDWFTGIAYMSQAGVQPLQTYLRKMITAQTLQLEAMSQMASLRAPIPETLKMGAIVLTTLPIVCVYPFVQKYFIKGLLIGSVKE